MALTCWFLLAGYRLTAMINCLMGKVGARLPVEATIKAQQRHRFLLHHRADQAYHRVRC